MAAACIVGVRRGNPDHHRSPLRSVTGDGLEYNLKTCIPELLANRRDTLDEKLGLRLLRAVEIEGEAGVFLEYMLDVREHL